MQNHVETAGGILAPIHLAGDDPIILAPNGQIVMSDERQAKAEQTAAMMLMRNEAAVEEDKAATAAAAIAVQQLGPSLEELALAIARPEGLTAIERSTAAQTRTVMCELVVGPYACAIVLQVVAQRVDRFKATGQAEAPAEALVDEPIDYQRIVFDVRNILNCGHVKNVERETYRLNTRYNDALARIATLERELAALQSPAETRIDLAEGNECPKCQAGKLYYRRPELACESCGEVTTHVVMRAGDSGPIGSPLEKSEVPRPLVVHLHGGAFDGTTREIPLELVEGFERAVAAGDHIPFTNEIKPLEPGETRRAEARMTIESYTVRRDENGQLHGDFFDAVQAYHDDVAASRVSDPAAAAGDQASS